MGNVTMRDKIEDLLKRQPGSSAREIAAEIFGQGGYLERVHPICLDLCKQGRLYRVGRGTKSDPYRYHLGNPATASAFHPTPTSQPNVP
jgi:hypothetical protein